MTNLQESATRISGQNLRRLWLITPIAIGGVLAGVIGVAALLPVLAGMRQATERLQELEGLRQELGLLRTQLVTTEENIRSNEQRKSKILGLIYGSGDLSTFLSRLQTEAARTGVQLELFEPHAAKAAPDQPPNQAGTAPQQPADQNQQPGNQDQAQGQAGQAPPSAGEEPPPSGPPELQGLRRKTSLITVRGTYPRLLTLMRNLEALNVLVVQSDLNLTLEEPDNPDVAARSRSSVPVTLKFSVSLYEQPETSSSSPATATAN
jgi:type IV pilus assembly protein PilO